MKKFVLSEDICVLLKTWGEAHGFVVPPSEFFLKLREGLKFTLEGIFGVGNVECITAQNLIAEAHELFQGIQVPIVSLDKSYSSTPLKIEINRAVNEALEDCGEVERFHCLSVDEQIRSLKNLGLDEIALFDDVIFSGNGILKIVKLCDGFGIKVELVITGIGIGEGVKKIQDYGIPVRYVYFYEQVIDEVCERDFYPGVPFSGRYVLNSGKECGAPYIFPFGKPCEWASIPESSAKDFSKFCLEQTISLWEEIEKRSRRIVTCLDVERIPRGIYHSNGRFIDMLNNILRTHF